eukprot:scaffold680_cov264-Pinguiococcus_pyrenoidosus.AAC.23
MAWTCSTAGRRTRLTSRGASPSGVADVNGDLRVLGANRDPLRAVHALRGAVNAALGARSTKSPRTHRPQADSRAMLPF